MVRRGPEGSKQRYGEGSTEVLFTFETAGFVPVAYITGLATHWIYSGTGSQTEMNVHGVK